MRRFPARNLLLIRLCLDRHIYIIITKICSSIHELQFFVIYFLYEFSHRLNHISLDKALYDQILLYRFHTVFHTDTDVYKRQECYKQRMEKGLSFLEFNYMIMQSYDFYTLFQKYGCNMEFGGDDQWSNMLGGTELILSLIHILHR